MAKLSKKLRTQNRVLKAHNSGNFATQAQKARELGLSVATVNIALRAAGKIGRVSKVAVSLASRATGTNIGAAINSRLAKVAVLNSEIATLEAAKALGL